MTRKELFAMLSELKKIFEIVRLVDVAMMRVVILHEDGTEEYEPYMCYVAWKKNGRCENCISAKAYAKKSQLYKFEFIDDMVYSVISKYIEVEGQPYMLEMVNQVTDETLFSAYGRSELVSQIKECNKKLYIDSLTGVYNRRYYEEQLYSLEHHGAFAMIDVDHFKHVNDTFGHQAGDVILQQISSTIVHSVKSEDAVIRYGGDEFMVSFVDMPVSVFEMRLNQIREAVSRIRFEQYPLLRMTVSIGGVYYKSGQPSEDMIREADRALYDAKCQKDTVVVVKR